MNRVTVSELELRKRLATDFTAEQIEELINEYVEASINCLPDADAIVALANKKPPQDPLRVAFSITNEEYQALASYFDEELPGTILVKRALAEFIRKGIQ